MMTAYALGKFARNNTSCLTFDLQGSRKNQQETLMKKIASVAVAAFLVAGLSAANAQSGGDNPGGRGVTSTGGAAGVTGRNTDGTMAAPAPTTGMTGTGTVGSAASRGDNANSMHGMNSPSNPNTGSASPAGGGEK
jgi:hypothetical protein